jgi:hypothetical protein
MFVKDPATGRKVLATRRRLGGGCHGKKNLAWGRTDENGRQVRLCGVCGKEQGDRFVCLRCEGLKTGEPCRVCAVGKEPLACEGRGGLCCRCAGEAG